MTNLPTYAPDLPMGVVWALVVVVIATAVISSGDMRVMKWLAILSSYGFGMLAFTALAMIAFFYSRVGMTDFYANIGLLMDYFVHIRRFASPISDYHEFYLFWWFAWSIMIGQFVARFVGGLKVWQLLLALLILPSIPIALWFSLLFYIYNSAIDLGVLPRLCMVIVGVIFVTNSLDSLIRLYSENLNMTVARLTGPGYIATHWTMIFGLILLYQFTPLKIEWIGLVVIGIYCCIYALTFRRRALLKTSSVERAPIR